MTDQEAAAVCAAVDKYLRHHQGFDIADQDSFGALINSVRPLVPDPAEDDLRTVAAMCALGPGPAHGYPPERMRDGLLHTLHIHGPDAAVNRIAEFAVAYGCGWRRVTPAAVIGWHALWPGARGQLASWIENSVTQCDAWLRDPTHVVSYDAAVSPDRCEFDSLVLADTMAWPSGPTQMRAGDKVKITCEGDYACVKVAEEELEPVRPGSKLVWTVALDDGDVLLTIRPGQPNEQRVPLQSGAKVTVSAADEDTVVRWALPDGQAALRKLGLFEEAIVGSNAEWMLVVWECTCGTVNCESEHRLANWDPTTLSLWAFLANAVKGLNGPPKVGAFAQGTFYGLLSHGQWGRPRLRLAPVEHKLCHRCPGPRGGPYKYEGRGCRLCDTVFHPARHQKTAIPLMILVDVDVGVVPAPYESRLRWRCSSRESRMTHCRVLTGAVPPANPGKEWDNYYDVPNEQAWMDLVLARKLDANLGYRDLVSRRLSVDPDRLRRWASARIPALGPRFAAEACPLCGAEHPQNATRLWVRTFAGPVQPLPPQLAD